MSAGDGSGTRTDRERSGPTRRRTVTDGGRDIGTVDQENPEWYEVLLDTIDDPVYVLDETGRFEYVNEAFVELVGYGRERILGSDPSLVKGPAAVDKAEAQLGRLLSSDGPEDVHFELEIQPREGDSIPCEDHMGVLPYEGDQFRGSVGVLRDISDRRARERELERQNDRLEKFASVVSHDLRNPLNVARARLELLSDDCESEHLDAIVRAHDRMETLIDDLLTLARQGESVTDVEAVDLDVVASRAWETVEAPDASLVVETERRIEADASRLDQLFENLFRNAVEHGGADVTVTVGPLADGGDTQEEGTRGRAQRTGTGTGFYVADDGVGLPEGEVFESGFSTTAEGTGFGLSIVEEIAEAHGWSVTATESAEGGARFEFTGVTEVG